MTDLEATPPEEAERVASCRPWPRPRWACDDWATVERNIHAYAADQNAKAFLIASTLRQFTQVWDLEATDDRGRQLVDILRARLARVAGRRSRDRGRRAAAAAHSSRSRTRASSRRCWAREEPETYRWWKTGLDRALSVAAIYHRLGSRIGTGFLVRAADLGLQPADELLVLTNFHVVNQHGASPGIRPEEAEVVFEAADPNQRYQVERIVWTSEDSRHDASVLRLQAPVAGHQAVADGGCLAGPGGQRPGLHHRPSGWSRSRLLLPGQRAARSRGTHQGQAADPRRVPGSLPGTDRGRQLRQPGVQCQALGGHRAAPQGRPDRHAEAQRRSRAATPPTRGSGSARFAEVAESGAAPAAVRKAS